MSELKDEDKMSKTDHKRVPSINTVDIRSLGSSDWHFGLSPFLRLYYAIGPKAQRICLGSSGFVMYPSLTVSLGEGSL